MAKAAKRTITAVHKRQQQYVRQIEREGFDYGLTVASAFVRSIRDLGYRSAATALDELVDNSIEAGAANIHIFFGYGQSPSEAKPDRVAIADDGYGMVREMIRAAVVWGGTDRENSRNLFGRYGYGLPSASVSQGQRFTVYSRADAGDFYAVTLDVSRINDYMVGNRVVVPELTAQALPMWVSLYLADGFPGGFDTARTIVVWDKLDRMTWKTTTALETNLLQHFGVVYRNYLRQVDLIVNGKQVAPIDPLFTTPGHRFYDFDDERAEALPSLRIIVPVDGVSPDPEVELRLAYMPPTFLSKDKTMGAVGKNANPRFPVRRDNHGFVVCRHGRQSAIRALLRRLARALDEIGAEPSPDTIALAEQLRGDPDRQNRAA